MSTSTVKYALGKLGQISLAGLFAFTGLAWFVVAYGQGKYQFLAAVTLTVVTVLAVLAGSVAKKVI
jgi:hypothetical protein